MKHTKLLLMLTASACFISCSDNDSSEPPKIEKQDPPAPISICHNNIIEDGEICDGPNGVPATCAEYDSSKKWLSGGYPECAYDCKSVTVGSCIENLCGNDVKDDQEICDGTLGVPASCEEFDSSKNWQPGGHPGCATDCSGFTAGSCVEVLCGNHIKDDGEICDGILGVPTKCSAFDDTRLWQPGGRPGCAENCNAITQGTCVPLATTCGNGQIDDGEECDGTLGLPESCSAWESTFSWQSGSVPSCSLECQIAAGSCKKTEHQITIYNYNVLFEYKDWMSTSDPFYKTNTIDRATTLYNNLKTISENPHDEIPAVIAIVETSPVWHSEKATAMFEDLGYAWVDNTNFRDENIAATNWNRYTEAPDEGAYYHTNTLYLKDRFELLEHEYIRVAPFYEEKSIAGTKTGVMGSVLREKSTQEIFLIFATHWDANMINSKNPKFADYIGWVAKHELDRIKSAQNSADFIQKFRDKYPNGHVFFGGDLNTLDLRTIYSNSLLSLILGDNNAELANRVNLLVNGAKDDAGNPYPVLKSDFVGAHEIFRNVSNLKDARSSAIELNVAANDPWSVQNKDIAAKISGNDPELAPTINQLFDSLNIVIDYGFYSPDMTLQTYRVMNDDMFDAISDHYAIKTRYTY